MSSARSPRSRWWGRMAIIFLVLTLAAQVRADGVVRFYYFFDPNCPICLETHRTVLEPLLKEYGSRVQVEERSIAEQANFGLLLDLEQQYGVPNGSIPEVIIGKDLLAGPGPIRASLKERIDHYLAQGGVELPGGSPSPTATVLVASTAVPTVGCDVCAEGRVAPATVGSTSSPTAERAATPPGTQDNGCYVCERVHGGDQAAAAAPNATSVVPTAELASVTRPTIHAAFFFQPGCDECERSEHDLQYIETKYPQVQIRRLNIKDEAALNQVLCQQAGVPAEKHLTAPALFVGGGYLLGDQVRGRAIEALIAPYLSTGAAEPWAGWEGKSKAVEQTVVDRFRSFGLLTIVGAGLIDGINPCAFATLIFLISYLSAFERRGRDLLATGAAFTFGVFVTYLGVGLGFLKALSSLPFLNVIGRWIYGATLLLCLALAWGSLADYRKARQGRLQEMTLRLPDRLRGWAKVLIRKGVSMRGFVLASLVLGFGVSLVELACTGQVYLPTIIFVLGIPAWRTQASLALVIYNVMFIVPLVGVFLLVYYGTTSQQLTTWLARHTAKVKLGTAVVFLLLAGWLGYSLVAL